MPVLYACILVASDWSDLNLNDCKNVQKNQSPWQTLKNYTLQGQLSNNDAHGSLHYQRSFCSTAKF